MACNRYAAPVVRNSRPSAIGSRRDWAERRDPAKPHVNCAALPEALIESELFGYRPGAFTGARREGATGRLREADGGVLFLDEIGDMPTALQSRLLRVLQEREITPLGGGRCVSVDITVVAASHRNLKSDVDAGRFRADLYYRIAQATLHLPPLREQPDLEVLVATLWKDLGGDKAGMPLEPMALERLARHPWPGNMRQLLGTLRTLIALGQPGKPVTLDDLPEDIRKASTPITAQASMPCTRSGIPRMQQLQRNTVRMALDACDGNVSEAARRLGISRSTIYRKLDERD
jgi:transcriptional regulator of acetoin/glycerol metabolism